MPKVENPLLQLKNVFLVERPQINKNRHFCLVLLWPVIILKICPTLVFTLVGQKIHIHSFFPYKLMLFLPKCLGFKLQLMWQLDNVRGRAFTRMLFQTVCKISRHQSKLGTFNQVSSPKTLGETKVQTRSEVERKNSTKRGASTASISAVSHPFLFFHLPHLHHLQKMWFCQ